MYRPKVYTASKIRHAAMWRSRARDYPEIEFTARWIQMPPGPDHNNTFWSEEQKTQHWIQDVQDVQRSDFLLAYSEPSDELKGTLVEVGCAIGLGKIVLAIGFNINHSWQSHPLVRWFDSRELAFRFILGKPPL